MQRRLRSVWWLLGLGSQLQIVASLSISEAFVLVLSPFIFLRYYYELRRDGLMPFFLLSILVFLGCCLSCALNQVPNFLALRGFAVASFLPSTIIVGHWLLRRDPGGFKWYLCGTAISLFLCTFIFQRNGEVEMLAGGVFGARAVGDIMSGPIYWVSRLKALLLLPTQGWYLHTPLCLDLIIVMFLAGFSLLASTSGRSSALGLIGFMALLLIGGKKRQTMWRIARYFWRLVVVAFVGIYILNAGYHIAASKGWLGEDSQKKYERQTHGDKSIVRLLIGGRLESFVGILACLDRPIQGWGPWAQDQHGYLEEFVTRFGSDEDIERMREAQQTVWRTRGYKMLFCHSYITQFWVWFGIAGLLFWLYALFVLFRYLRQDINAVPQWYAWLACSIPGVLWSIFFSPFNERISAIMILTACLMARAVRLGRFQLPPEMLEEIAKNEQKRR